MTANKPKEGKKSKKSRRKGRKGERYLERMKKANFNKYQAHSFRAMN